MSLNTVQELINNIKAIIENYQKKYFSGQLKLGIENGIIKSIVDNQNLIDSKNSIIGIDYLKQIDSSIEYDFWGTVLLGFYEGVINYSYIQHSRQGNAIEEFIKECRERQKQKCKYVKIAVKKSDL